MNKKDLKEIAEIFGEIIEKTITEIEASNILQEISKEHSLPPDLDFGDHHGGWIIECNSCFTHREDECRKKGSSSGFLNGRIQKIAENIGII